MKRVLLLAAACLAASSAYAREPKKKEPTPPSAPPVEAYELRDAHMGEALTQACLASPAELETYDSRDDLLIAKTVSDGRVFFHLKGGCDANTMMFADTVTSDRGDACVSVGQALVFKSSYGDEKKCSVTSINRWRDDEVIELDEGAEGESE